MKRVNLMILAGLALLIFSCRNDSDINNLVVKRIQYDVPIVSSEEKIDWWVNNVEGSVREELLRTIFSKAYSGEVKVYDYFHQEISPEDVKSVGTDSVYMSLKREYPPYEEYDTLVISEITYRDVSKLRFLEEWKIDESTLHVDKKVVGMAPVYVRKYFDESYNQVLFWFYFDERYPDLIKNQP